MAATDRILVPVDFSNGSRAALDYAVDIAERVCAAVDVLCVWDDDRDAGTAWTHDAHVDARSRVVQSMEDFLLAWGRKTSVDVNARLASGEPISTILEVASGGDYSLMIVARDGTPASDAAAEQLTREAACPVVALAVEDPLHIDETGMV